MLENAAYNTLYTVYILIIYMEKPEAQVYAYSVKIEMTAKGMAMPTVHVYANDMDLARNQAVQQYKLTISQLKEQGLAVASEVSK